MGYLLQTGTFTTFIKKAMVAVKRLFISILYWWIIVGLYVLFSNLTVHGETLTTVLEHLYFAFVDAWYVHIVLAVILASLSYLLCLIIRRV